MAAVAETITVEGESPLIDTKKSELSGRVEQRQVESLPVNGRDWLGLVSLVPGARGNPGAIQAGSSGSDMAKYQVDGVDVTNQVFNALNIKSATGYTLNYFSRTYLQPSSSTNLFYQPRQIQFGFRVSY